MNDRENRPEHDLAKRLPMLQKLATADQDAFLALCTFQRLGPGERLFSIGEPAEHLHLIVEGAAAAELTNLFGRAVIAELYGPGSLIGMSTGEGGERYAWDCFVRTPCLAAAVPTRALETCVLERPAIALALMQVMAEIHLTSMARVFEFSALDVRSRLHSMLVNWAGMNESHRSDDGAIVLENCPSHTQIASVIGATREGVNRELKTLEKRGVIRGTAKRIEIRDVSYLEASVLRRGGVNSTRLLRRLWRRLYIAPDAL